MISLKNVLFNTITKNPLDLSNTILLILKQYIYASRCLKKKCTPKELKEKVEFFRKIELYNARKTHSMNTHYCKWSKQNQMNATSHDYVYDITVNDRFNH